MGPLRIALMVVFGLISLAITVLVLMQEGKSQGLGSISGMADAYMSKNKVKTLQGKLIKITAVLCAAMLLLGAVLQIGAI